MTILEKFMYIRAWFNRLFLLSLLLRYLSWDNRNIGSIPPGSDPVGFQVASECYCYQYPIISIFLVKKLNFEPIFNCIFLVLFALEKFFTKIRQISLNPIKSKEGFCNIKLINVSNKIEGQDDYLQYNQSDKYKF